MNKVSAHDLRLKAVEAKCAALEQHLARLVSLVRSRTEDLRNAHNALVQALKGGPKTNKEESPNVEAQPAAQ